MDADLHGLDPADPLCADGPGVDAAGLSSRSRIGMDGGIVVSGKVEGSAEKC